MEESGDYFKIALTTFRIFAPHFNDFLYYE